MDLDAELVCDYSPDAVFAWVDDLTRYPQWMGLVHQASEIEPIDGQRAWNVELRARLGLFARSKRLVMVRSVCESPLLAVFERREHDGREHSMWRLTSSVSPHSGGSAMHMQLHYGGGLWTGGLAERVLHDEIKRSRARLLTLLAGSTP